MWKTWGCNPADEVNGVQERTIIVAILREGPFTSIEHQVMYCCATDVCLFSNEHLLLVKKTYTTYVGANFAQMCSCLEDIVAELISRNSIVEDAAIRRW